MSYGKGGKFYGGSGIGGKQHCDQHRRLSAGYGGSDYFDPLPNGAELILPVLLLVSRYANRFDVTKRTYAFTGCTVMGKSYGELNAESSGLLVETTTIAYREMLCIDTVWDDIQV